MQQTERVDAVPEHRRQVGIRERAVSRRGTGVTVGAGPHEGDDQAEPKPPDPPNVSLRASGEDLRDPIVGPYLIALMQKGHPGAAHGRGGREDAAHQVLVGAGSGPAASASRRGCAATGARCAASIRAAASEGLRPDGEGHEAHQRAGRIGRRLHVVNHLKPTR
jgi:hypothetical protein